jgi:hypothetical protein
LDILIKNSLIQKNDNDFLVVINLNGKNCYVVVFLGLKYSENCLKLLFVVGLVHYNCNLPSFLLIFFLNFFTVQEKIVVGGKQVVKLDFE